MQEIECTLFPEEVMNNQYSRIENPSKTELWNLQSREVKRTYASIEGRSVEVVEKVAERGCFTDGHRRYYSVERPVGMIDIMNYRGRAKWSWEVLASAPTRREALKKAKDAIARRAALKARC